MRLLFDQNISFRIVKLLNIDFPNCKHVSDVYLQDCTDKEIWEFANKENYTIITQDVDFYDISLLKGNPPKIIWLRVGNLPTKQLASILIKNKIVIQEFITEDSNLLSCLEID